MFQKKVASSRFLGRNGITFSHLASLLPSEKWKKKMKENEKLLLKGRQEEEQGNNNKKERIAFSGSKLIHITRFLNQYVQVFVYVMIIWPYGYYISQAIPL